MMLPQGQKQDPGIEVLGKQSWYHCKLRTIKFFSTIQQLEYTDTKVLSSLTPEDVADISDKDYTRQFLCLCKLRNTLIIESSNKDQRTHTSAHETQKGEVHIQLTGWLHRTAMKAIFCFKNFQGKSD